MKHLSISLDSCETRKRKFASMSNTRTNLDPCPTCTTRVNEHFVLSLTCIGCVAFQKFWRILLLACVWNNHPSPRGPPGRCYFWTRKLPTVQHIIGQSLMWTSHVHSCGSGGHFKTPFFVDIISRIFTSVIKTTPSAYVWQYCGFDTDSNWTRQGWLAMCCSAASLVILHAEL